MKVARLVQAGKITVDYLAKDKKNIKTEKYYYIQAEKLPTFHRAKKISELRIICYNLKPKTVRFASSFFT